MPSGIRAGIAHKIAPTKTYWEENAMLQSTRRRTLAAAAALALGSVALGAATPALAQSGDPIRIGYGMSLTGPLAANGKSALLAQKIWEEDVNAKGGLLGRPVKLVYYD